MISELNISAQNVLEPLCDATSQIFKPIDLMDQDYLYVGVDDECEKFITAVVSARPSVPGETYGILGIGGSHVINTHQRASFESQKWLNRVPEKTKTDASATIWELGGTDYTALVMRYCWGKKIIFKTEEAKLFYAYLINRFMSQTRNAHLAANYHVHKIVPTLPDEFLENPNPDFMLSPYQKTALACSLQAEMYGLLMEQGTGKTAIVVNRVNLEGTLKRLGKIKGLKPTMFRALILCPKAVLGNWKNEFKLFSTAPGKVVVLRGADIRRQKCILDGVRPDPNCIWSACICSLDNVESMRETLLSVPWDLVVIDESHKIKNPNSKRFKSCKMFHEANTRSRMILTGTVIANTAMDLFAQLEFLGKGMSGFSSFKNFKTFHGKYVSTKSDSGIVKDKLVGIKGVPLLQERLARNSFMITQKQAGLEIPDKVYDTYEVEMAPQQAKVYKTLAEDLIVKIDKVLEEQTGKITVDHILTMMLRLAQVTSGHIKLDKEVSAEGVIVNEGKVIQIGKINPKVVAILEMLQDEQNDPNGKCIIWAVFIEDLRVVSEALHNADIKHVGYHKVIHEDYRVHGAEDAEIVFNTDKDCKVFIANPASGGHGLNLLGYDKTNPEDSETFCNREIFMSSNWNAGDRSQAEMRAVRRGTRSNVRITDLVVPGSIDEEIRVRILKKQKTALQIQDVRDILANLVNRSTE